MKPSEDLFELIKSLSRNEKGYFKKYSRLHVQGDGNKYILLFDAIEGQVRYNEEKLIRKFKEHDFTRQISVAKNYLYHQIMKAMESFHQSIHTQVRSLIHRTEFLYEKGLYKQALKVLHKAKETARENDMYWSMLELFRHWEMNLALKNLDFDWVEKISKEESKELALAYNTKIYRDLFFKMARLHTAYGVARDKKHLREIESIIRSPYLKDESKAKTFEAKLRFWDTLVFYAETLSDEKKTFLYSHKVIRLFNDHPEKIKQNILSYIGYQNNMLVSCNTGKKFDDAENYLADLEKLSGIVRTTSQQVRLFYTIHHNRLNLLNSSGRFAAAEAHIPEINSFVHENENELSPFEKTILFTNIAIALFGNALYKECIFWLNKIRNEVSLEARTDIESFLRIFYLIAQYEAGNTELLPYLIQSTYRFLRKKKRLYKFESIVIGFLRRQQSLDTKEKLLKAFGKLRSEIVLLQKDQYEKNIFEFFDFISWLESRIQKMPFEVIVRRKAGKR